MDEPKVRGFFKIHTNTETGESHCGGCCDGDHKPPTHTDTQPVSGGTTVGYSKSYADGWDAVFGRKGAGGEVN